MKKILYVEDMIKCYEKTLEILGNDYNLDWRKDFISGLKAMTEPETYYAGIFDVNLNYDPLKSSEQQTKEGLKLIKIVKLVKGLDFPVICISAMDNRKEALEQGADLFMWKKEFWEKGKKTLDEILYNGR